MIICCLDSRFLGLIPPAEETELLPEALLLIAELGLLLGFLFFETGTELLQPFFEMIL
jgi:hypothetical protein